MPNFISLHNHSHFSILSSLSSPKDLLLRAKELNQSAIAVTDYGNMAGIWSAYKASKETGVKLIVGCEFYFLDSVSIRNGKLRFVVLLAKNAEGYKNLLSLNKIGFENSTIIGKRVIPVIDWELLKSHSSGLICLTGCGNGIVGQLLNGKQFDLAEEALVKLHDIFGDSLGVEIQSHNLMRGATHYSCAVDQPFTNRHLIRLATKLNLKIVPTTNSFYLKKENHETHDVLLAIGSMQPVYSNARIKYDVSDFYLKSGEEVKTFFSRNYSEEFAKSICENTVYFANMCENPNWVDPKYSNPTGKELPVFSVASEPDYEEFKKWSLSCGLKDEEDNLYLRFKCESILKNKIHPNKYDLYKKRLEEELDVFNYCGSSSYMLITADIVNYAKKNNIPAGPGRGSCGGSLVAYLLGIHMADPIKYGLVFPRFFSKLRNSYADVDMDFSKGKRHLVIEYIISKYGKENFAQISNIIETTPKVFVRDVARSCDLARNRTDSVKLGNNIADVIPKKDVNDRDVRTYNDIVNASPLFSEFVKKHPEFQKYSGICGKPRAFGLHAAGVIVSKRPIASIVPIRLDKDRVPSVQLDKDAIEEVGLVKMDILGIETLDIIEKTNSLIYEKTGKAPDPDYEAYDEKTYDLISSGDTYGVFQFGTSAGTVDLCRKIKPKSIEDLAIITTLARPASKDIREAFIKARQNKIANKLLHKSLENSLKETYGFPLYDESLLILAKDVAGWELDEADKLRKLTKEKGKNPEKAEKWRLEFIEGAVKNNIDKNTAIKIWHEIVEPFGKYSFNKSHAVLYSMISFHTAYLKAHYPVEFLLANLMFEIRSNAPNADENIDKIKQELRNNKITILPPDVNKSTITYELKENNELLTGFEALKSVGDDAITNILELRPYASFDDFMLRVNSSSVRAPAIQSLAASGCFDSFGISRKSIYLYCSDYRKKLQVWLKKHDPKTEKFTYPWPEEKEWSVPELYALEKNCLGEAFVCKKDKAYISQDMQFFDKKSYPIKFIRQMQNKESIPLIKAEIKSIFEFKVKKANSKFFGEAMIKATIEDEFGEQITLTVFPNKWKETKYRMKEICGSRFKFEEGIAISFSGTVNLYEDEIGIILENFFTFCPHPQLPKDLKAKKIIKNNVETDKNLNKLDLNNNLDEYINGIEDSLFDGGFIDLSDED